MSPASLLTVLTGPWATAIATVLLVFTGGGLMYGPEEPWGIWITRHAITTFCLLILGANFLYVLGLIS